MPPLQQLFETHALVKILDFLTLFKDFEYTRTDIAEETGISRRTLYEVFPTLEKYGLVQITKEYGKVKFYKLNLENPISKRLVALADEIALYDAQTATGIKLTTELQPEQASSPYLSPSHVKVTMMKIEANSAAEIREVIGEEISIQDGEAKIQTMNSTQSDFNKIITEVIKTQKHCP